LLKGRDLLRANTIFNRKEKRISLSDDIHGDLARAFAEKMNESEDGISKVRRDDEKANSGSPRKAKGRTGRGKSSKTKKTEG
jgi:hypothetical protein